MRTATQVIASAVVLAVAAGGWFAWKSLDAAKPNTQASQGRPGGGPGAGRGGGRAVEVVAVEAKRENIVDIIEAVGNARANEAIMLTAKQTGTVARVLFEEGQIVREGQALVEFEARERKADLETAKAQYDEVKSNLDRAKALRAGGAVTQARIDELEAQTRAALARVQSAEARRTDLTVTAPFTGRVGMRQVSPGALVSPGTQITTLDDLSVIKVDFAVPQSVLGELKQGLVVNASTNALKDRKFQGKITVIDTRVDPVTRSVRVVANFDNKDEALKPGLFLNIELEIGQRPNAVLVPEEAIVSLGTTQYVFKIVDGRAIRTEVKTGNRKPGMVEITEGLKAGEQVVVRGVQNVIFGEAVRVDVESQSCLCF
jgi:membrane fusion protein (multidrug efflux system)